MDPDRACEGCALLNIITADFFAFMVNPLSSLSDTTMFLKFLIVLEVDVQIQQ